MSKLNMYIPIRDETLYMIKIYQYLFNKYWNNGMQVYFLGYKQPDFKLDKNIHFISIADSREKDDKFWSNKIIDFISSIDDEFFYFSLEDLLVIRPVDFELLDICEELLDENIGRIDLWNSVQFDINRKPWLSHYKDHKGITFVKESQEAGPLCFRVSCSNAIWSKKWFLKTLERNWSGFQWEHIANDGRNHNDGFDVISPINRWTPSIVHAISGNWIGRFNIDGILPEDLEHIKSIYNGDFFIYKEHNQVVNLDGYQPAINDKSNF